MTERWVQVAAVDQIPTGHAARVEIDGRPIALFNVAGNFHAVDDTCSHAEASLSEGELDVSRCAVECPLHGAVFDLLSGEPLTLPAVEPVQVHEVRVDEGVLYVGVVG